MRVIIITITGKSYFYFKNTFLIVSLFFCFFTIQGQHKYKIEYDLTMTAPKPLNNGFEIVHYELSAFNDNQLLDRIYSASPIYLNPITETKDEVVEYANPINRFGHISVIDRIHPYPTCGSYDYYYNNYDNSCTIFQYLGFCETPKGFGKISPIVTLQSQNANLISNGLKKCETQSLQVFDCGTLMKYSVHSFVGGVRTELLPYGEHSGNFTFDYNDIPNVGTAPNFQIQVYYVQNPTQNKDRSDLITLSFIDCSPALNGPIIDIQPLCSNSINHNDNDNGSFTVTFDRELDDSVSEKMNLQVYRQVGSSFDGYASKVVTKSDFTGTSYTWEPKNLPGGVYKLFWQTKSNNEGFDDINTVPDAYDESNPFTLTTPPALSVSGTPSPVQCFRGNDGSITVTPNGGTPGTPPTSPRYQYSIDNGTTWQQETLFDSLTKGDYTILIKDNNGCEATSAPITVNERFPTIPDVTGLSALITNPTLINGNNGRIAISVSSGSGNYTNYAWTKDGNPFIPPSGSTNTNIINLYEGVYTIVVTDSNGCSSDIETFTLTDPEPIDISINMTPNTVNCSDTKVNLIASATGGFLNSGGDYTYLWDDGTTEASLTNVGIGNYQVTVSDQGGNSQSKSFQVQGPEPITAIPAVSNVGCKNGSDGTIQLTINGGTGQYTVNWTKLFDNT
ncbi:SprB repeat-containing protein, partial [Aquimarina atlantica]|uniref:SprB repeat-containing protein n=1 Tax=Aquimarina atlantica TaxID=1317122 RepID=UPI001039E133